MTRTAPGVGSCTDANCRRSNEAACARSTGRGAPFFRSQADSTQPSTIQRLLAAMASSTVCVWAAPGEELEADWRLVQCLSEVAASMPEPGEGQQRTWDLSNLLLSGEPVSKETCVDWLNLAYSLIHAKPYDAEAAASFSKRMSAVRLCRLLEFADAVASPAGLLASIPPPSSLFLPLRLGEEVVQLELHDKVCGGGDCYTVQFGFIFLRECGAFDRVNEQSAPPYIIAAFEAQAFAQPERLLFLAYKLDVAPPSDRLHKLMRSHTAAEAGLFSTKRHLLVETVFSRRVQQAAGSNANLRHLLVAGVLAAA